MITVAAMRREGLGLVAILVAALAVRAGFALVVPPLQAPDEAAHVHYVETIARTGTLPVAPPRSPRMFAHERAQSYQPPLAYVLLAPVARALAAIGATRDATVRGLRMANALAGVASAAVGYRVIGHLTAPGDPRRLLVVALLALFPGFLANSAVVNNDAIANLLATLLWLPLLARPGPRAACTAGAVLGAACLAKLSTATMLPLLFVVPLCRDPRHPLRALAFASAAGLVAAGTMVPWLARNHRLYGDALALDVGSMSFEWLASLLPPEAVAALVRPQPARAFWQFWGHFGVYNNLHWTIVPAVLVPLTVLGIAGWLRRPATVDPRYGRIAVASVAALLLAVAGLTSFSVRYHAAWQGRYLYTAMLPATLLVAGGWQRLLSPRLARAFVIAVAVLLVLLDTALLVRLHAFFEHTPAARWPFAAAL